VLAARRQLRTSRCFPSCRFLLRRRPFQKDELKGLSLERSSRSNRTTPRPITNYFQPNLSATDAQLTPSPDPRHEAQGTRNPDGEQGLQIMVHYNLSNHSTSRGCRHLADVRDAHSYSPLATIECARVMDSVLANCDQRYRKHNPRCRVSEKECCCHGDPPSNKLGAECGAAATAFDRTSGLIGSCDC
jgi:hypothetical protein